jgi:hypothetical protein
MPMNQTWNVLWVCWIIFRQFVNKFKFMWMEQYILIRIKRSGNWC